MSAEQASAYALKRLNDALEEMGVSESRFTKWRASRCISTRAANQLAEVAWHMRQPDSDGREPTFEDVAAALEIPQATVFRMVKAHAESDKTARNQRQKGTPAGGGAL